jgi:hypothetical protein
MQASEIVTVTRLKDKKWASDDAVMRAERDLGSNAGQSELGVKFSLQPAYTPCHLLRSRLGCIFGSNFRYRVSTRPLSVAYEA